MCVFQFILRDCYLISLLYYILCTHFDVYLQEEKILAMIDAECDKLCSRGVGSAFRNSTAEDLKKFNFDTLASDLQRTAPTVWSILCTIATPTGKYNRRRPDWHHPL